VSAVDTRVGSVLAGYRIERLLGRGGMSSVYLAEHLRLHRKVALKLMAPELAHDERFRERFLRESQLAASLDHPNVVPVYDADESGGVLYIAMRYVEGSDLRELLRRYSPLPPARAVAIVGQAAAGLDAAHRRGLVHRDVKPGNILIGEDDHVYVSDFGLTKQASSQSGLTATGQLVGTVDYVAPEQIQGQQVDGRADVYALTCVLYETLVGAKPFEKDTEVATIWAHIQDPPPSPSAVRPELPRGLDAVIARGMAKQPGERYAACRELVEAARRELGVSSGEISQPPVTTRRRRLDRRLLVAAGVLIAASVLGVVLLTRGGGSPLRLPLNAVGAIDPKTNKLVAAIPVGHDPTSIAAGGGSIWVANDGDGTVTRIDGRSRKVVETIGGFSGDPRSIAFGDGALWVTTREDRLFRIAPANNHITAVPLRWRSGFHSSLPEGFGVIAGYGAVWLVTTDLGEVLRVDPSSGRVVVIEDGRGVSSLAVGNGAVWVSEANGVSRIDANTNVLTGTAQIGAPTSADPVSVAVAFGEGSVWAAKSTSGEVWQVSPASTTALGRTLVGENVHAPVVGEGAVWVARRYAGTVVRIDPQTRAVTKTIDVGPGAYALTTGSGLVWVTTLGLNSRG
jgi:streptogramin lyase/tRNA A-37 threonylcarbamoyl transferase component Bud32